MWLYIAYLRQKINKIPMLNALLYKGKRDFLQKIVKNCKIGIDFVRRLSIIRLPPERECSLTIESKEK